jgi:hypothetical protein
MLKKISDWIYERAHGRLVLLFFGLQILFTAFILPYFQEQFQPEGSTELLDLKFGFDTTTAFQLLDSYGEVGRSVYLQFESIWDVLFPLVYTLFNILFISFLLRKTFPENTKLRLLNLLPLLNMTFDFGENFGIVKLLGEFPNLSDFWVNFASTSGVIKWVFSGIGIGVTLVLLLSWLTKAVRRR